MPATLRAAVVELRRRRRWGADRIAHEVGLAASTVQAILTAEGLGRLDRGDRAKPPAVRYVRDRPGELVYLDVNKIAAIPPGGGRRIRGRGYSAENARRREARHRLIHTAVDDRTRLAYSEVPDDEQAATATSVNKTRPRRPQTNSKAERLHRILLKEWAHIRPRASEHQRQTAYQGFIHFHNHHRTHGALNWATPTATHTQLAKDNLPEKHS